MILDQCLSTKIYETAALNRAFEVSVFEQIKLGNIKFPAYLSAGQEYISATIAVALEEAGVTQRQIFIQHRGHSIYLSFGGDIDKLVLELLGDKRGCANGMGGSASIHSVEANIYGHDGLMGSQGPISTGMCYANKMPTICFTGDAAVEEDYFLASIGWASTKKLPIIFVVEDNNLSILTEKKVRRNWEMHDVAKAFKMKAFDINDDPQEIFNCLDFENGIFSEPMLLNINTNRMFWHSGAGIDDPDIFDRHQSFGEDFTSSYRENIQNKYNNFVSEVWKKYL
jgi:TPP-dependent pyruvate/acetoin dehydrogenase alpha subunit